jgi:hypothetical protein
MISTSKTENHMFDQENQQSLSAARAKVTSYVSLQKQLDIPYSQQIRTILGLSVKIPNLLLLILAQKDLDKKLRNVDEARKLLKSRGLIPTKKGMLQSKISESLEFSYFKLDDLDFSKGTCHAY